MSALLLIAAVVGQAEAELPAPTSATRVVEVDCFERNTIVDPNGNARLEQVVFWGIRRAKRSPVTIIDRGWANMSSCQLLQADDGSWCVMMPERDLMVVAPECFFTVTDHDPEFTRGTETNHCR